MYVIYILVSENDPEKCVLNLDCHHMKSCINQKCTNPCPGACGLQAQCEVLNYQPYCTCMKGFIGDPFVKCVPVRKCKYQIQKKFY